MGCRPTTCDMAMLDNPRRMAELTFSVGSGTRGDRVMTPAEAALAIRDLMRETGETVSGMARRLHVHEDTCRAILSILDLPREWRGMWRYGRADGSGRLPFSMAAKLGPAYRTGRITKEELDMLKEAALDRDRPARCEDISGILSYHHRNPGKAMSECIAAIMSLAPDRAPQYVIITDISGALLARMSGSGGTPGDAIRGVLSEVLGGEVQAVRVKDGKFAHIMLDKAAREGFYALAARKGLPAKDLVNRLCSEAAKT